MATRSDIGVRQPDGTVLSVYCHFDSYENFKLLNLHYNSYEKAMELINNGSMSSLSDTVDSTVFYSRDRGESFDSCKPTIHTSEISFLDSCSNDYTFYWDGDQWRWRRWNQQLSEKRNIGEV